MYGYGNSAKTVASDSDSSREVRTGRHVSNTQSQSILVLDLVIGLITSAANLDTHLAHLPCYFVFEFLGSTICMSVERYINVIIDAEVGPGRGVEGHRYNRG